MKYEARLISINESGTEETMATLDLQSPNVVLIGNGESKPVVKRLFDTFRKDENHYYQQIFTQIVDKLVETYKDYIGHVSSRHIGFLVDNKWEVTEKTTINSRDYIDIRKANKETKLYLGFQYEITLKLWYLDRWSEAQLHAAILSQLLRIEQKDGSIKNYGESFHSRLVATFGIDYLAEDVQIQDVLEDHIVLGHFDKADKLNGQVSIDDIPFAEEPEESDGLDFIPEGEE
jgi:hypothetical protein